MTDRPIPRISLLLAAAALSCLGAVRSPAFGETETLQPQGVYATIDTVSSGRAIDALRNGTDVEKDQTIAEVESHSDAYCPAVFFSLAAALFDAGKTDEALFWLYAGRIRTQFDMRRCTDKTVAGGYEQLNASVPELLRLIQFEDIRNTKKIVGKAIKWDKETPYNYDPRWIALHGMGAVMNATVGKKEKEPALTIPENEWKGLAEKNRTEYWDAFREDMSSITAEQLEQIRDRIKALKQGSEAAPR